MDNWAMNLCKNVCRIVGVLPRKVRTKEEIARSRRNTIELVRMYDNKQYDVVNDRLHHYAFTLSDGTHIPRIGIVEVLDAKEWCQAQGINVHHNATVLQFPTL
jgi:hypothetical protein